MPISSLGESHHLQGVIYFDISYVLCVPENMMLRCRLNFNSNLSYLAKIDRALNQNINIFRVSRKKTWNKGLLRNIALI